MGHTTVTAQKKTRSGRWVGVLFGMILFGVGAGFTVFGVVPNLWDVTRMQDWVQVQADVVDVDLDTSHSKDGTTYQVTAGFSYVYQGQRYHGNRVGIADGGHDNVGDWHQVTYGKLVGRSHAGVWVNPEVPSESVFDRELRWGLLGFKMIFVVVFGGIGAAMLWFSSRTPKPVPAGMPAWQARSEWTDNRISSSAKATLWVAWSIAVIWNAISAPIMFGFSAELDKGNNLVWIALLFPLVGFGLLVWAVNQTRSWRRFGASLLQMDPFPGAIGGDVAGAVELRLPYSSDHRFRVVLTCQHVYRQRTNDGTKTVRKALWQDDQQASVHVGVSGTRLQFHFQPPDDLPESSEASEGKTGWHEWHVQISADLTGVDFNRSWQMPVFKDAGQQTTRIRVESRHTKADPVELPDKLVQVRSTGAGIELYYPYFRNPGVAAGVLCTGAGFIGFAWLFHAVAGKSGPPDFFLWIFIFIGALIAAWGLYLLGNSLRVTVGSKGLSVVRTTFGVRSVRHVDVEEISSIQRSIGMQASQGNRTTVYYRIMVHTRDGRKITAGNGMSGASRVDALIERLNRALDKSDRSGVEQSGSRIEPEPAAVLPADEITAQQRMKGVRQLINVGSTVFFFAIVFWQFRDVIFQLL